MTRQVRIAVAAVSLFAVTAAAAGAQADAAEKRAQSKAAPKTALDHLHASQRAIDDLQVESLTPQAAATVKEVKQRLTELEQTYVSHGKKSLSKQETPSGSTRVRIGRQGAWSALVPDIDRLIGQLIDAKSPIARQDTDTDSVKRHLRDARSHLTAFAKAASGTSGPPR